jgi:hypothetical protein
MPTLQGSFQQPSRQVSADFLYDAPFEDTTAWKTGELLNEMRNPTGAIIFLNPDRSIFSINSMVKPKLLPRISVDLQILF